ncbi:phospholipase D-like protein [Marinobacter sp. LV10R520-4]|uniref:PLDc N-terminal domain-containing protein n=1 Tax=Marinobacter sp. LV10R520-4 TaxID=1761796 RepID=UPI000BF31199|nr:PLDc N-terminal domain-containing protein [Marinobacter sp. LV10R520-4]PFG53278.1 phospholipase D-like protein [Marinobacter sp. LV10R520-4]
MDSLFSSVGNAFGGLLSLAWLVIIILAIVKVAKSRASTIAKVIWIVVLLAFPLVGFIIWLLFGPRG